MSEEKPEQMPEIEDIFVYHEKGYTHFVVISQDGEIYASNDIFLPEQVSRDNAIAKFREVKPFTSDHFRIVKLGELSQSIRLDFVNFYSAMFDATWKIESKQSINALTLSSEFFFITLEKEKNEYIVSIMDYVKGDTEEKRFQTLNELKQFLDKKLDLNAKSEIWDSVVNLFNTWEGKKPIENATPNLTQILIQNKVKASGDDPIIILEPISISIQLNPFEITINEKIEDAGRLFDVAGEIHKLLEPIHTYIPKEASIKVPSLHDDYGYWDLVNPPSLEQIGIEEPIKEIIEEKIIEEEIKEVNTDPMTRLQNSTKAEIIIYMNDILKMNVKPLAKNKDPKEKLLTQIEKFLKSQEAIEQKPIEEKVIEKEIEETLEKSPEMEKTEEKSPKEEETTKKSKPKSEKKTKESKPRPIEEKTKPKSSEKPASLVDFKIDTNKHIFYISVESSMGLYMVVKEFKISKSIKSFNFGSYPEMELWLENNGVTKDQITY